MIDQTTCPLGNTFSDDRRKAMLAERERREWESMKPEDGWVTVSLEGVEPAPGGPVWEAP